MSIYQPVERLQPRHAPPMLSRGTRPSLMRRMLSSLAEFRQALKDREELDAMTCSELQDIGITRADIPRVFGPEFAREYAKRGSNLPGSTGPL